MKLLELSPPISRKRIVDPGKTQLGTIKVCMQSAQSEKTANSVENGFRHGGRVMYRNIVDVNR